MEERLTSEYGEEKVTVDAGMSSSMKRLVSLWMIAQNAQENGIIPCDAKGEK